MAGTYTWDDQTYSITLAEHTKGMHNQLLERVPLYSIFYGGKRVAGPRKGQYIARRRPKEVVGGRIITFRVKYDFLTNFGSVGEGDSVAPEKKEGIGHATASWRYALGSGLVTWQQKQQNSGPHKIVEYLSEVKDDIYDNAATGVEAMLISDGTGNGNKDIMGLGAMIRPDPTSGTLFGISQSSNTYWRNKYKSSYSAKFLDGLQGLKDMRSMYNKCAYNSKGSMTELTQPDIILMSTNPYESYEALAYELKRINTDDNADLGFPTLRFKNARILYVPGLDSYVGSTGDVCLFVNTKHIYPYIDKNEKWRFTPFSRVSSEKPRDSVCYISLVSQMVCDNLSRQGYLEWTDATQ